MERIPLRAIIRVNLSHLPYEGGRLVVVHFALLGQIKYQRLAEPDGVV